MSDSIISFQDLSLTAGASSTVGDSKLISWAVWFTVFSAFSCTTKIFVWAYSSSSSCSNFSFLSIKSSGVSFCSFDVKNCPIFLFFVVVGTCPRDHSHGWIDNSAASCCPGQPQNQQMKAHLRYFLCTSLECLSPFDALLYSSFYHLCACNVPNIQSCCIV